MVMVDAENRWNAEWLRGLDGEAVSGFDGDG